MFLRSPPVCLELGKKTLFLDPQNEPALYCMQRALSMQPSLDYLLGSAFTLSDVLKVKLSEECQKQVNVSQNPSITEITNDTILPVSTRIRYSADSLTNNRPPPMYIIVLYSIDILSEKYPANLITVTVSVLYLV